MVLPFKPNQCIMKTSLSPNLKQQDKVEVSSFQSVVTDFEWCKVWCQVLRGLSCWAEAAAAQATEMEWTGGAHGGAAGVVGVTGLCPMRSVASGRFGHTIWKKSFTTSVASYTSIPMWPWWVARSLVTAGVIFLHFVKCTFLLSINN